MLFDGVCNFCSGAVQMVIRNDPAGVIHFAPLQSGYSRALLAAHPELAGIDSIIFVEEDGRVSVRSDAVLRIASRTGGWWRVLLVARLLPRAVRDWFYDGFANRRYQLFGKRDSCMMPTPEVRSRFVDLVQD